MSMQRVLRTMKSETKVFDYRADVVGYNGVAVFPLHQIAQGIDQDDRVGNKICATGLYVRLVVAADMTPASNCQGYRVLLVRDNQQVGDTDPTAAGILEDPQGFPLTTPIKREVFGKFTILDDRLLGNADHIPNYVVSSTNDVPLIQTVYHYKQYLKLANEIRYNGAATTDIQKGGLYLLVLAAKLQNATFDYPDGTNGQKVHIQHWSRLTYTDA